MSLSTKTVILSTAASVTQTLPEKAVYVSSVTGAAAGAAAQVLYVNTKASTSQTLPVSVAAVNSVDVLEGAATSIDLVNWPVVSTTPTSTEVEFTGTASSPSASLTFGTALTVNGLLMANVTPAGAISQNATTYTPVTGTPTASEVQFTGTPASPSDTLTFLDALEANGLLIVSYVPEGNMASNL